MSYNIHLMCGIPGSGKSTFCKSESKRLAETGNSVVVVSRDLFRKGLVGENVSNEQYFSREDEVFEEFVNNIIKNISQKVNDIFVDATHISERSRRKLLLRLKDFSKDYNLIVHSFDVDFETACKRNETRTGFELVPHMSMKVMHNGWRVPTLGEFSKNNNFNFKTVIIENH